MRGRRGLAMFAALAVVLGAQTLSPPGATAAGPCSTEVGNDFDGGGPDIVLGLPSYDLPGKPDAGAIVIFSNVGQPGVPDPKAPTARRIITADNLVGHAARAGARFGAAVSLWPDLGDFDDADRCSDLLVGAPGQTVAGKVGAGEVSRVVGSSAGITKVDWRFDESDLAGTGGAQAGAGFGSALAVEPYSVVAIGAPGRDIAGRADAGRVVRLEYTLIDEPPTVEVIEQGRSGAGAPEAGDRFGEVLELMPTGDGPYLIIGVPREDVGNAVDAGAVAKMPPNGPLSLVTQNSAGAAGTAESGDRYGAAIDTWFTFTTGILGMVAIGVPGEDLSGRADAGMVAFADYGLDLDPEASSTPLRGRAQTVSQNTAGVPGVEESGDQFGAAVQTGEFGHDDGRRDLVVGVPGENLGSIADAGSVSSSPIRQNGGVEPGRTHRDWHQDSPGVSGAAEPGDRFGSGLSQVLLTDLEDDDDTIWAIALVTVPGENLGSVADAGLAYLGYPPGQGSVVLEPPVRQTGAATGLNPFHLTYP